MVWTVWIFVRFLVSQGWADPELPNVLLCTSESCWPLGGLWVQRQKSFWKRLPHSVWCYISKFLWDDFIFVRPAEYCMWAACFVHLAWCFTNISADRSSAQRTIGSYINEILNESTLKSAFRVWLKSLETHLHCRKRFNWKDFLFPKNMCSHLIQSICNTIKSKVIFIM